MLATAASMLPVGDAWAYEFKWDGVRALVDVSDQGVRIHSRAGNDVTGGYPDVVAQVADTGDALLDGEIVAFADGRPSFQALQARMHVRTERELARLRASTPATLVVFDVLRRFGVDLTPRPWHERRATLERMVAEQDGWTLSPYFDDGPATEAAARQHGLEGVVAKRTDAAYRPGRSDDWRKLRFVQAGDFVVLGWETRTEHPNSPSSLVLGAHGPDGLRYAGKVGSGLSARVVERLRAAWTDVATPPLTGLPGAPRGRVAHWVRPDVVVEVEYALVTQDGVLRQPVFRGIRTDKHSADARGGDG